MPRRGENIYKQKDARSEARYLKEITVDGKKEYGSVYAKSMQNKTQGTVPCVDETRGGNPP